MKNPTIGAIIHENRDVELLRLTLDYHKSIGVQHFLICLRDPDQNSLNRFRTLFEEKNVSIFPQPIQSIDTDSNGFIRRREIAFQRMVDEYEPDWITAIDTDEFLVSKTSFLPSILSRVSIDTLSILRFNPALSANFDFNRFKQQLSLAYLQDSLVFAKSMRLDPDVMRVNPEIPWIINQIGPKFITRLKGEIKIGAGFHSIVKNSDSRDQDHQISEQILSYHLPFSTLPRFKSKIATIHKQVKKIGHTFAGRQAWHWRRLMELHGRDEAIVKEFDHQFFNEVNIRLLMEKDIVKKVSTLMTEGISQGTLESNVKWIER